MRGSLIYRFLVPWDNEYTMQSSELNYDDPIHIGEGVYWVGYYDQERNLHCNPYLILEQDEAVLIDGGSRTDFSTVMVKILQTGINPSSILRLIYQHYDPDLCSSIPNFEEIIDSSKLRLISHKENNVFIRYYSVTSKMECITAIDYKYTFSSGRKLTFVPTPYSHSAGSFVTFDEKTGILFSSDLFGSYDRFWQLYITFSEECKKCDGYSECPYGKTYCPFVGIKNFHERIMTSTIALRYALDKLRPLSIRMIAPQHGSIIHKKDDIILAFDKLRELDGIGIDGVINR